MIIINSYDIQITIMHLKNKYAEKKILCFQHDPLKKMN